MHFSVSFRHEMEDSALAVGPTSQSGKIKPSPGRSKVRFKIDPEYQSQLPKPRPQPQSRLQVHTQSRTQRSRRTHLQQEPTPCPPLTTSHIYHPHRNYFSTSHHVFNPFNLTTLLTLIPLPTAQAEAEKAFEQSLLDKSIRDLETKVRCRLKTPRLVIYEYICPPDDEDDNLPAPVEEDLLLDDDDDDDESNPSQPHVTRRIATAAEPEADPDPDDERRQIHLSSLLISLRSPAFIASVGAGRGWKDLIALFVHLSARDLERGLRSTPTPTPTKHRTATELGPWGPVGQGFLAGILKRPGRRRVRPTEHVPIKKKVAWGPVVTIQLQEHKEPRKTGFRVPGMGVITEDLTESD